MKGGGDLLLLALILFLTSSSASPTVDCESNGIGEWQILTKQNFSSQIRLHPHILLFVTVPWSGESRSLMKEISQLVTNKQKEFGSLKLMFMYRNTEQILADAIGAIDETTILYYQHSISYKYQGIFRARNILYSFYPNLFVSAEEVPLKTLNSEQDLRMFIESTDKSLLLLEFCGWTPKLLAKVKNNGTENGFIMQGFNQETDRTLTAGGKDNQKGMENGKLKCGVENEFSRIPWLGDFSPSNDSDSFQDTGNIKPGVGLSCSLEEFQQFDSFFSKFMTIAREFFLPRERHRFGLVSERSLLPSLGVVDSGSWLAMLYFTGCPSCSKILKEGDDLKSALKMDSSIVMELEGEGQDLEPDLPANKASILLFVDRSSDSSEARRESKEALHVYRELALRHQMSYQMDLQNFDQPEKSSIQAHQALKSTSGHPRLKLSPTAQKIKLKDKMSIMIINDGKHVTLDDVTPDLQGSTLRDILEVLLKKNKEAKLSSLAKEVGFRLLSDDLDIKIADALPSQTEVQSNQVSTSPPEEGPDTNIVALDKDQLPYRTSMSAVEHEEKSKPTVVDPSSTHYEEEKTIYVDTSKQLISVDSDKEVIDNGLAIAEDVKVEGKSSSQVDKLRDQQLHFQGFKGSFFFCDGNYRLLRALTGGSMIPSLVIIDPISQQHYVFSENATFSFYSMADFLHKFLNGSLLPYQRSESILQSPREATHPPFVNLDFHEVDSIPRVTAHTFSELVLGFNQSNTENAAHAWNQDVLVLFSSSWCGFCQRMELVVREVYRAIKGYIKMVKSGSKNGRTVFSGDNLKNVILKLPLIYLLDCTLNDCSLILKSINQKEVYPALMLFPAERKNAVSYKGDMAVADVIKFIADYGRNSQHLTREKGILWSVEEKGGRNQNLFKVSSRTASHVEAPLAKDSHEVLLKNRTPKREVNYNQIKSHAPKSSHESGFHVVVGSILTATDKLLNSHPFDKSQILIVKADQDTGFQGLIFNKHIRWDALHELEAGLEFLKEAPLSFGGPVIKRGMPLVALTRRAINHQFPEVLPDVYFLDQLATIHEIEVLKSGNLSVTDYWLFLGFSNWGWDQLFDEISDGSWNLSDNNAGHFEWPLKFEYVN